MFFMVITARGARAGGSSASNENCSTQVTQATLAPMAVPNYEEQRSTTLRVPIKKKELDTGKYCYVYYAYKN